MKRRDFITFLGGAAATWPLTARAQEPRRVIGVLGSASYGSMSGAETAFIQGLTAVLGVIVVLTLPLLVPVLQL
jgi:putative ABC transport system substrate-binding protein